MADLSSESKTCEHLQVELDKWPAGKELALLPSEYTGPIVISRPITIDGHGATLCALEGPVCRIDGEGVVLRNLNIEVTQRSSAIGDTDGGCALEVRGGQNISLENVEVIGSVRGLPGEEGQWRYPFSLKLGEISDGPGHRFVLRLYVPVPCKIISGMDAISVSPQVLTAGRNEVEIHVEAPSGALLQGKISLQTRFLRRQITVSGYVTPSSRRDSARRDGEVIYEPADWEMSGRGEAERVATLQVLESVIRKLSKNKFTEKGERTLVDACMPHRAMLEATRGKSAETILERFRVAEQRLEALGSLRDAVDRGDDVMIDFIVTSKAVPLGECELPEAISLRVRAASDRVALLQQITALHTARPGAEEELLELWNRGKILPGSTLAGTAKLGTASIAARMLLAEQRIKAVRIVCERIDIQNVYSAKTGALSGEHENAICDVYCLHKKILGESEYAELRIGKRVRTAAARIERGSRLARSCDVTGDEREISDAWGDGRLLERFEPISPFARRAADTARLVNALDSIEKCFTDDPFDDARLLRLWNDSGKLHGLRLAQEPSERLAITVNGQRRCLSPTEAASRTARRIDVLEKIGAANGVYAPLSVRSWWDDELCAAHPAVSKHLASIRAAFEKGNTAILLVEACKSGEDDEVCRRYYDNCRVNGADNDEMNDLFRQWIPRIRTALVQIRVGDGSLQPARFDGDLAIVRWNWSNTSVKLCCLRSSGVKQPSPPSDLYCFAEDTRIVTREEHAEGISFSASGDDTHIAVWPVLVIDGRRVLGENVVRSVIHRPTQISYSVRRAFWGKKWVLTIRSGTKRSGLELPGFVLSGRREKPPRSLEDSSRVLCEVPAGSLNNKEKLALTFEAGDREAADALYVRLFPLQNNGRVVIVSAVGSVRL